MCLQLVYEYCDFGNQIKQWEFEYFRDSEVRKQKVLNTDGLNEVQLQKEVDQIINKKRINASSPNSRHQSVEDNLGSNSRPQSSRHVTSSRG